MFMRFSTATAFFVLVTAPAFADCAHELSKLEPAVTSAETGSMQSGMPATKHQQQVLSGDKADVGSETTGSTGGQVEAISPHQQQVMGKGAGGEAHQTSQIVNEANDLAEAGNEDGCMQKLTELKKLLGQD